MRRYDGILVRIIKQDESVQDVVIHKSLTGRYSKPLFDAAVEIVKPLLNEGDRAEFFPHQEKAGSIFNVSNGVLFSDGHIEPRRDCLMTLRHFVWGMKDVTELCEEAIYDAHCAALYDKNEFDVKFKQLLEARRIYPTDEELTIAKSRMYWRNPCAFGYCC